MPTWWPTFSPTTTEWASGGLGGAGALPTGGTYSPTVPWPTYSPTPGADSSSQVSPGETVRDIDVDSSSSSNLSKKQLKDIKTSIRQSGGSINDMKTIRQDGLKSNLLQSNFGISHEEYVTMDKKDRKYVKKHVRGVDLTLSQHAVVDNEEKEEEEDLMDYFDLLEQEEEEEEMGKKQMKEIKKQMRTASVHHDESSSKSSEPAVEGMMGRTAEFVAHHFAAAAAATQTTIDETSGKGTLDPTASPPSTTYYPTDDQTYSPTTIGHMNNLELHSSPSSSLSSNGQGARQRRRLNSSSSTAIGDEVIGQWTSIPPNDEFFTKYPEWKSRQEEIYKLRIDKSTRYVAGSSSRRQLQDTTTTEELIPNQLYSAQFLEMDTSTNMNIINQDDTYLNNNVTYPPNTTPITNYTLSYTSISSTLNPDLSIEEQLDIVPGGVILVLVGLTNDGEVIRNRIMWTYTMGCGMEDVTVMNGDEFGWAMFVSFLLCCCCCCCCCYCCVSQLLNVCSFGIVCH